ncbi:MAG: DUF1573 domain-containing protein [Saprospiraceae bacterium]
MQISYLFYLVLFPLLFIAPSKVEWNVPMEHDFGDIARRTPVVHDFSFKNVSGEDLIIDNVRTSCGCTAPDWDLAPIPADSIGHIRIEFDARDAGYFRKKIKVYFDGQRKAEKLYIEGFVED